MLIGFSDKKIVSILGFHSLWSKRACREIIRRKDDFIPLLLNLLDEVIKDPGRFMAETSEQYFPAAMLLAQFRAVESYPRLVNLISYDDDTINRLWDDILFEFVPLMLRDTFNGDAFLLPALIENRSISPWARAAAVEAWGMHYFDGFVSREEISGCFRHLIRDVYTGEPNRNDVILLSNIAKCIRDQRLEELIEDVKDLYARKCVDESFYGDYESYVKDFSDPGFGMRDSHIDDTILLLGEWSWFQEEDEIPEDEADHFEEEEDDDDDYDDEGEDEPRRKIKIGRNEPCPCGSGKKYKNCCMGKI